MAYAAGYSSDEKLNQRHSIFINKESKPNYQPQTPQSTEPELRQEKCDVYVSHDFSS